MSQENVELAAQGIAAWQSQGVDGILDFLDADVEYRPADEPPFQGKIAVRRYFQRWLEPWEDYSVRATEYLDAGETLIVGLALRGRGKGSGIEIGMKLWCVFWFRDGKATRWVEYLDRAEALDAVGLRE